MLEGWYCRTLANEQSSANQDDPTDTNVDVNGDDSGSDDSFEQELPREKSNNAIDYKSQYRYLKRKFKFLIYENEFFQDALRINQRRLLKVSRDRAFLLDRLLQYEKPENTSSESEETESSDDDTVKDAKKRKLEQSLTNTAVGSTRGRKKKTQTTLQTQTKCRTNNSVSAEALAVENQQLKDERGHVTSAEVEKKLQLKPPLMQSYPERASETVPHEMFSNEPSLDSESNDHLIDGSSPTHVAAEECVPMEYSNN